MIPLVLTRKTKQRSAPAFTVNLRASFDDDSNNGSESPKSVALTVKIEFTLTYPKTPPIVTLPSHEGLTTTQVRKIQSAVNIFNKDNNNRNHELAFDIISLIQDHLNDYASGKNNSLEEERQKRLEEEAKQKKEEEEERKRKQQEEELRLKQQHNRLVQDEIRRRQTDLEQREQRNLSESRPAPQITELEDIDADTVVNFDRTITARVDGNTFKFNQVHSKISTQVDFFGSHFIVKPVIDSSHSVTPSFLLTEIDLNEPFWMTSAGKKLISVLEKDLEIVKHINHPNVASLYEFKIVHTKADGWRIYLLTEYSPILYTSLTDLLDTVETVSVKVAKDWTSQILDGLECIHKHRLAHKLVNLDNIHVVRNKSTKDSVIKLSRACFGYLLIKMNSNHPFNSTSAAMPQRTWEPPEMERPGTDPVIKSDIYDFGTVLCQLLAGKDIVKRFRSPQAFFASSQAFSSLEDTELYNTLTNFLEHTFDPSPKKRYSVLELLTSKFIRDHDPSPNLLMLSPVPTSDGRSVHLRRRSTGSQMRRMTSSSGQASGLPRITLSRYETDFSEVQILGRGAYGEVVKARHRLEGQFYAIKKIRSAMSKVDKLLGEIQLLSRVSHRHIVRYYSAWLEEDYPSLVENAIADSEDFEDSESNSPSSSNPISASRSQVTPISRSQSFMNQSSQFEPSYSTPLDNKSGPEIFFAYDSSETETDDQSSEDSEESSDEDGSEDEDEDDTGDEDEDEGSENESDLGFSFGYSSGDDSHKSPAASKTTAVVTRKKGQPSTSSRAVVPITSGSHVHPSRKKLHMSRSKPKKQLCTIYIQMEYCENHTLSDLIKDGLYSQPDEYWRLFRQIIDALDYIHVNGIIHRDLKPVNIFIDQAQNVKIGDFGLAKAVGQAVNTSATIADSAEELTQEVGTGLYIAPEVLGSGGGVYGSKVDMYSLGIIFFEMVFPMTTAMERGDTLRGIRSTTPRFPKEFLTQKYGREYQLVSRLVDHDPNKRPSAKELQMSSLVPTPHEDEIVEKTIQKIINDRGDSRLISQVCNVIFSKELDTISAILYDRDHVYDMTLSDNILMETLKTAISELFQHHGAVSTDDRPTVFPAPSIYEYSNIVKLMDKFGTILQLPYDLTYPFARRLAQDHSIPRKSFVFGKVFRECEDKPSKSTEPRKCNEISFDIVNNIMDPTCNESLDDAETIKVLGEIVSLLPLLNKESVAIILNHSDILEAVLKFCSVPHSQHSSALMLLGQFGKGPASPAARAKFLDQPNMTSTTLMDLEQFGFQMDLDKCESHMLRLMKDSKPGERFHKAILYLQKIEHLLRVMDLGLPIFLAPLSHYNAGFYKGGIMFQLIIQEKKQMPPVFLAAGGRYNSLINSLRTNMSVESQGFVYGAVGFNVSLDMIFKLMKVYIDVQMKKKIKREEKNKSRSFANPDAWTEPRCDVLVCTSKVGGNKENCLSVLNLLWGASIRADCIQDTRQSDQIAAAEADNVPFICSLRQPSSSAPKNFKPVRIITLSTREHVDTTLQEVVPKLTTMIREWKDKIQLSVGNSRRAVFSHTPGPSSIEFSSNASGGIAGANSMLSQGSVADSGETLFANGNNLTNGAKKVKILSEGKLKGGKKNKWKIEQEAIASITRFKNELNNSEAYYSLDVKDDILDAILTAELDSADDWKRKVVPLSLSQKAYLLETQTKLANEITRGTKHIYLYSSKTGKTVVYSIE